MDLLAGEKRPTEGEGIDGREVKRVKGGEVVDNVRKVAEMVLVLAAMGKMRGGRLPTEVERELMADARYKLTEVCQVFAPKDVIPRDAFGDVIEDLGLNKSQEQRLGFRPPKMSIAEKLLLGKRKFQMERSERFGLPPPTSSQRFQGAAVAAVENRGMTLPVQVAPQDKPSQVPILSASLQPASAVRHVAAANSTSLPYQLPTSEVRPAVSNALSSSHPVKDFSSLPLARVDQPPFRVDGRPNGSSHASQVQVQAHPYGDQTTVRTSWPVQSTQSDNKVPMHSVKIEGAAAIKSGMTPQPATSKPLMPHIAIGNTPTIRQNMQSTNFIQSPPTGNTHAEVANIVQKFLHMHLERPLWTTPSRDYMNKPLTCQMCQSTVSDVDSILICDNCEKGYHLKCLQTANHKGAPRGEWHCFRCLAGSHGKPLPPKYGRVMRNTSTAKMSPNSASVHLSPDKKTGRVDNKYNLQRVTPNGSIVMQNASSGPAGNFSCQPTSESKLQDALAMKSNEVLSTKGEMDDKSSSGTHLDTSSSVSHSISLKKPREEISLKPKSLANSEPVLSMESYAHTHGHLQSKDHGGLQSSRELPLKQSVDNHLTINDSAKLCGREVSPSNANKEPRGDEIGILQGNDAEPAPTTTSNAEPVCCPTDQSCMVDWVGNVFEVVDEKSYYQSCCINGVVYKLHDHVLVQSDNGKLIPSKLQVMWEDNKTRIKWVTVNKCYFPSDLPVSVGRPCGLEGNEVYGSVCGSTMMARMIHGPCDVLPPNKFEAERERRLHLRTGGDDGARPCYLCKWIYDESKGLFRDVSC